MKHGFDKEELIMMLSFLLADLSVQSLTHFTMQWLRKARKNINIHDIEC